MVQAPAKEREHLGTPSIVDFVDDLLTEAHQRGASDIHIEPTLSAIVVRFRVDGVLAGYLEFPKTIHSEVISRIKVLAHLRTDEHASAHDGRFRIFIEKTLPLDVRVSIMPTYWGENAVLRLLSDRAQDFSLENLGFGLDEQKKIIEAVGRPQGMVLATGPTGSGKTTTLYTLIKIINSKEKSVITLEDPIEYAIEGITQIQANAQTNLTFAHGLRSILRQDPNIIMVGEIRDSETAKIAVNTALTGHLLLSTVHTETAATTLPRLLDMGIDPYLVASTMSLAIGQRLVRRVCGQCRGAGCEVCAGSGFKGRLGVSEVLVVDDEIRDAILRKAPAHVIQKIAMKNGMTTMYENAIKKVEAGETTLSEVTRVLQE